MSIEQYKEGKFRVRIYHAGQRHEFYKTLDGRWPLATQNMAETTERDIQGLIRSTKGMLDLKQFKKKKPLKIETAIKTWINLSTCSLEWIEQRERIAENLFLPAFAGMSLDEITDGHIKKFYSELREKKFSDKYCYNILGELKALFNFHDVKRKFPKVTFQQSVPRYLNQEQQNQVFEFIREQDLPIFTFMRWTGCRPSEAAGLLRENIFLKSDPPYVVLATVRGVKGNIKTNTKTKKVKPLYVIPEIEWTLHPKEVTPYVFTRNGRTYSKWMFEKAWDRANRRATEKYGTPRINLYNGLKHSFVSQRLNSGYPIDAIMGILGHTDKRTTMKYGAYDISKQREILRGGRFDGVELDVKENNK
jgi:integrase